MVHCRTLFATHYHELTQLDNKLNRIANYTMEVKEWNRDIIFLHKIIPGIADSSYGIHVAELTGLPKEIINSAKQILTNFEKKESIQIKNHYKEAVTYKENEALTGLLTKCDKFATITEE